MSIKIVNVIVPGCQQQDNKVLFGRKTTNYLFLRFLDLLSEIVTCHLFVFCLFFLQKKLECRTNELESFILEVPISDILYHGNTFHDVYREAD